MRYWTSDTHLGHLRICELSQRPWENVDDMNRGIIERWNNVVGENDDVMVLGDLVMGKILDTLPLASRLNGNKYLIPGNHDRVHKSNKNPEAWLAKYEDAGFYIMPSQYFAVIGGVTVKICHFPYAGEEKDSRYADFHPTDEGDILLHGHVHELWRVRGRMVNVGQDAWNWTPVSDVELEPIVQRLAAANEQT